MQPYTRLHWSVPLWGVALFSLVGSWYSFAEPGRFNWFVLFYGSIAVVCIAVAVRMCLTQSLSVPMKLTFGVLSLSSFGFIVWLCGALVQRW
jgi:hypothetical protein